jgi:hypothetical protein
MQRFAPALAILLAAAMAQAEAIMGHRLRLPAVALALLLIAGGRVALADDPASAVPDPTVQAQSQALVDRTAYGRDAFRVDAAGTIIHIQSGMACPHSSALLRLGRLEISTQVPIGDDVTCDYFAPDGGKTTIFATRRGATTRAFYFTDILAAIRQKYPDARPTTGPMVASLPELGKPLAAAFTITKNGRPYVTSVWVSEERDWLIEVRATYPPEPRHDPELLASMYVIAVQKSIHDARPK